ncbi:uncharacterized protein [Physcomitrium patens]|uniref:HMA domain-containing protein n=1 Tax=Physcomitrium patens TaxID=3218 RepID=A0A2K1J1H2_PHYPA|nr:uncharacterized protein DDB_G0283357-like [Physcomitrium patens]PNR35378.1 hypothetical protein PHYPA_023278 [Physcomitrium patens]|eukprot:XP_024402370.1 uncharacterized protein DDB_G0283357-like [Physcomitrella patens]
MAGRYFYDPRPFYGGNNSYNLMPLDEVFYGRYEPVPYWMDQRMGPLPAAMAHETYSRGQKQMVSRMRPEVQQYNPYEDNFMAFKRPEVRDDMYSDMYRRGYPQVPGYGAHPEMLQRQMNWQTQDDTWLHAMIPRGPVLPQVAGRVHEQQAMALIPARGYADEQNRQMVVPMNHMASRSGAEQYRHAEMLRAQTDNTSFGNNQGGQQHRQLEVPVGQFNNRSINNNGDDQYRQMDLRNKSNKNVTNNNNHSHNNSSSDNNNNGNNNNNYSNTHSGSKQTQGSSNQQFGNMGNGSDHAKSQGQGGKSMNTNGTATKQGNGNGNVMHGNNTKQQQYTNDDWSSDGEDDGYENVNKFAVKGSAKQGNGHQKGEMVANNRNCDNYHNTSGSKSASGGQGKSNNQQSNGGNKKVSFESSSVKSQSGQKIGNQSKSANHYHDDDDDDSSDEHESHCASKKGSKGQHMQGNVKLQQNHGGVNQQPRDDGSYKPSQQGAKHVQYGSQSNFVELKVPICCDNCERKVRACLEHMDGVDSVTCDQWQRKVTVYGNLKADTVLKRVRRVKKTSELWQQAKR